jgi:hypothetical protein
MSTTNIWSKKMKIFNYFSLLIALSLLIIPACGSDNDDGDSSDDAASECTVEDYCEHNQTCQDPGAEVTECVDLTENYIADKCPKSGNNFISCQCSCLNLECSDPSGNSLWGPYGSCITACIDNWCPTGSES